MRLMLLYVALPYSIYPYPDYNFGIFINLDAFLTAAFLWKNINTDTLEYSRVKCYNGIRALSDLSLTVSNTNSKYLMPCSIHLKFVLVYIALLVLMLVLCPSC